MTRRGFGSTTICCSICACTQCQELLKAYAGELGLDTARFNTCLDSGTHAKGVSQDRRDAAQRGLRGTPSFLVNDRVLVGGPSADYLASLIDPWLQ